MKKILLLSDTHSYIDDRILKYAQETDEIWHAGDIGAVHVADQLSELKPFRAVYGNIDNHKIRTVFPMHQRFTVEGVMVWMTHIGGYPPKYNKLTLSEIQSKPPRLFICGHSHILKVMPDKKKWFATYESWSSRKTWIP